MLVYLLLINYLYYMYCSFTCLLTYLSVRLLSYLLIYLFVYLLIPYQSISYTVHQSTMPSDNVPPINQLLILSILFVCSFTYLFVYLLAYLLVRLFTCSLLVCSFTYLSLTNQSAILYTNQLYCTSINYTKPSPISYTFC